MCNWRYSIKKKELSNIFTNSIQNYLKARTELIPNLIQFFSQILVDFKFVILNHPQTNIIELKLD